MSNRWTIVRLQLWAPIWAAWHRDTYRGFREIGLPNSFSALVLSRMMTLQQARRLGWSSEALCYLAQHLTWHRREREYRRTWPALPAQVPPPTPEQVKQLIRWGEARPSEGDWYILNYVGRDEMIRQTDAAMPYLKSAVTEIDFNRIVRLASYSMPYPIFEAIHGELRLAFDGWLHDLELSDPAKRSALYVSDVISPISFLGYTLKPPIVDGLIDWWEVPGWVAFDRPHGAGTLLGRDISHSRITGLSPFDELRDRMIAWHPVNLVVGDTGSHAVLWWKAGFTVKDALHLLATEKAPTAETLAVMAALRGDDWRRDDSRRLLR